MIKMENKMKYRDMLIQYSSMSHLYVPIIVFWLCILMRNSLKLLVKILSSYCSISSNCSQTSSKLFDDFRIGYNSIGAGAHVNHLHFHMLFGEDLVNGPLLPIEKEKTTLWKKTSLINPQEEINLVFSVLSSTMLESILRNSMDQ